MKHALKASALSVKRRLELSLLLGLVLCLISSAFHVHTIVFLKWRINREFVAPTSLEAGSNSARGNFSTTVGVSGEDYQTATRNVSSIATWAGSDRAETKNLMLSEVSCYRPDSEFRAGLTCNCYNCCIEDKVVYVFDQGDNTTHFSNVTSQYMSSKQTFGILHAGRDSALQHSFAGSYWTHTPVHFTSIQHTHILAIWLWNADVWGTWQAAGWGHKDFGPFHWMLSSYFKGEKGEYLKSAWLARNHPGAEAPVVMDNEPSMKACYRHLMIGHHHLGEKLIANAFTSRSRGLAEPSYRIDENVANLLRGYRDLFVGKMGLASIKLNPKKAILISRKDSQNGRRILNEMELVGIMEEEGFEVEEIEFSNVTFEESNKKIRSAAVVFGSHGAGFANIMVCQNATTVIEAHPWGFQKWGYARLSKVLGLDYRYWVAHNKSFTQHSEASSQYTKGNRNFYRHRDYRVDLGEFQTIVKEVRRRLDADTGSEVLA